MLPFIGTDLSVRPYIIAWMARDNKLEKLNLVKVWIWCIIKQYYSLDIMVDVIAQRMWTCICSIDVISGKPLYETNIMVGYGECDINYD